MTTYTRLLRKALREADGGFVRSSWHYAKPIPDRTYQCAQCLKAKPGTEFVDWKDETKLLERCKECRARKPDNIPNWYVKSVIRQRTKIPADAVIPKKLMEIVRLRIQLNRLAKEREAYENHQRHR